MRAIAVGLFLLFSVGCSSDQAADQPQDTQSQRSRDSAIAESNLPGVQGALEAADSAAARRARIDSAARMP